MSDLIYRSSLNDETISIDVTLWEQLVVSDDIVQLVGLIRSAHQVVANGDRFQIVDKPIRLFSTRAQLDELVVEVNQKRLAAGKSTLP